MQARPTFEEALSTLNTMLRAVDEKELGSMVSGSFGSLTEAVEYMQVRMARARVRVCVWELGSIMSGSFGSPIEAVG